jgi:PPOX class probable F420-dependent enzyme
MLVAIGRVALVNFLNLYSDDPNDRGIADVDILRFNPVKIVEHCDVLQEVPNSARKIEEIVFTTYEDSLKATNIQRDNRVSICVDDQTPQFSFVTIHGTAKIVRQKYNELLKWNTRIAERYMGKSNAKAYGKRNSTEDVILVRVQPTKIIAEKDIAAWE